MKNILFLFYDFTGLNLKSSFWHKTFLADITALGTTQLFDDI